MDYDYLVKLIVIGDSGVGKSCLLLRFSENTFSENYISTIGVDFKIRTLRIGDKVVKTQIWDTAGQERFRTIVSSYYRGAHGVMYVFDVTDAQSFENIEKWRSDVELSSSNCVSILVGNKVDLPNREVDHQTAQDYARQKNMRYVETSAKTGSSVEAAFVELVRDHVAKLSRANRLVERDDTYRKPTNGTEVNLQKASKCC